MGCACPSSECACSTPGIHCACNCSILQPRVKNARKGMMVDKRPRCNCCKPPGTVAVKPPSRTHGPAGKFPVEERFE